ncbi:MAG: polysaccharide pyruvyl transferase family protein [Prevotella sp.]|nr:polysaccharide pyruvyl transferase family protein [Prevotella sp.]
MKKILYILAPNDRFNYGDLLFSKILSHYFKKYVDELVLCSTSDADLRDLGGDKVNSYQCLYHANPNNSNYLIVAGGESLFARWSTIMSYVDPKMDKLMRISMKIFRRRVTEYITTPLLDRFYRKLYHIRTRYPFSIGKNELPSFKCVIYNSLGASWLLNNSTILKNANNRAILESVDYISVRDCETQKALKIAGFDVPVMPDCAILMSKIFDEDFLVHHINPQLARAGIVEKEYVFFQANFGLEKEFKQDLIKLAKSLYIDKGKKVCLCPIGTALGHNDDVGLKDLALSLDNNIYFLIDRPSVWDIMWLIKNAYLYIGSSLHGVITSMSYGTPFIGHSVSKLYAYIEKWCNIPQSHFAPICEVQNIINRAIKDKVDISEQYNQIMQSFTSIANLLDD